LDGWRRCLHRDVWFTVELLAETGLLAVNPALDREERRAGMVPVTALGRWAVRRAHGGPAQGEPVLQLRIELVDSADPVIWRRVLVPAACPLVELHTVIQAAMGWQNGHLHQFSIGEVRYGPPGTDLDLAPEDRVRLDEVAGTGTVLEYLYDFGDDWEHQVTVEATTAAHADSRYPRCISGEGVCPPEDCGGIPGYELLRRTLADPSAPGHEDMLEWLGLSSPAAFDPARFDVRDADLRLAAQWRSTCPG
jgi:Plasmid pRiA4b ORF-3-like protein